MGRRRSPDTPAPALWLALVMLSACGETTAPPVQTPTALAFAVQPAGAAGGTPFTTQPVVEVRDASGAIVATATATITLRLDSSTTGATLGGTLTVDAVAGKATFTDLTIDKVGGYSLSASADNLSPAVSNDFTVVPGAPSRLRFATEPAGASGGTFFTTQPVVEVFDAVGNRVAGSLVTVTVALGANPHGGHLTGTSTITTTTGLARFTDLALDSAATG